MHYTNAHDVKKSINIIAYMKNGGERMKTLKAIGEQIESKKEFGDIPAYSVEVGRKYIYVCKNNGQFHRGDMEGVGGYATFVGKYSRDGAIVRFLSDES